MKPPARPWSSALLMLLLVPLVSAGPKVQLQKAAIDAKSIDVDTKPYEVSYGPCLWTIGGASSRFCRSSRECCPPQVCARAPASKYGYCTAAGEVKCSPACSPDQWCAPGKTRGTRRGGRLLTSRPSATSYTCRDKRTPLDCFTNAHCPGGHICRITSKGNCCYPTTCSPKCGPGWRCQKLLRRCARPPPNASPCYCPPVYRCRRVKPPTTKPPPTTPRTPSCDPPCGAGQRCILVNTLPGLLREVGSFTRWICVTDKCHTDVQCGPGYTCRKHRRGNCCFPVSCSKKCPPGQTCKKLSRPCGLMPGVPSPPCDCDPVFVCKEDDKPPPPQCNPPCPDGLRCGISSGGLEELQGGRGHLEEPPRLGGGGGGRPACVRDQCSDTKSCPSGSECQRDERGNCCRPVTCASPCADNEVCRQLPPTPCYNPGPNPPPCFCPPQFACQSRCDPPCRDGEMCAPDPSVQVHVFLAERYKCLPRPRGECQTDSECPAGSSCRQDARGNCCFPTSCPNRCPIGERCQVLHPPCPRPPEPAPPCYCKPSYQCTSCTGLRCPIG